MLLVSSMVCIGSGAGVLASGSSSVEGFPGLVIMGLPVAVLGARLARRGLAVAVREGERYALMGPNGTGKALVVAALLGLQFLAERQGWAL